MKKEYRNLLLALLLLSFLIYFYCYLPNSKIVEGVANSCWEDTRTLQDSIATFTDLSAENIITSMCNIYNRGERAADPDDGTFIADIRYLNQFVKEYEGVFADTGPDDIPDTICQNAITAYLADKDQDPGVVDAAKDLVMTVESDNKIAETCTTLHSAYQLAKKLHDNDFESVDGLLLNLNLDVPQDDNANTTVVEDGECDWTQFGTPEAQLALTNIESCGSLPNTSDVAKCKEVNRTRLGKALGASGCLADEELLDYDHINMLADSLMSFRLDRQGDRDAGWDGDRDAGGDGDRDAGGDDDRDAGGDGDRDANIPAAPEALPPDVKRRDESTFSPVGRRGSHPIVYVDAAPLRYRLQGEPEWGGAPSKGCINLQNKEEEWTKRWQEISRVEGSDADACSKYCATDPECKWFWHYDNGRCCPKKEMSGGWDHSRNLPGRMYRLCREGATGQHSPERCT
uniref:Uncharacterized protein n=1 Tax=viral metagenome TaxID=1070528 RepID=A0A6C0L366_9ZZZZ|tara:strand:- start:6234 stop:7607 length:1374 start_codon:yes stop_codon:yes gene_type:complete